MDGLQRRGRQSAVTAGRLVRVAAVGVTCAVLGGACRRGADRTAAAKPDAGHAPSGKASLLNPPHGLGLQPVTMPDFSAMEASVREQMRARYSSLAARLEHPGMNSAELGTAYGELGELLMAATYFDPAEACYLNAEALAPADVRWPYYLGHLYKAKGPLAKSAAPKQILALTYADAGLNLYSNGIIASDSIIKSSPDIIRRFVAATMQGLKDAIADPKEAGEIMHKHHREVDADIATGETRIVGTLTGQTGLPLGAIDPERVQKALEIVGTSYPLKNPVKPDDIYAPGFVAK